MADAEYFRARRKAIKEGTWVSHTESQSANAINLRAWRASKKSAATAIKLTAAEHQRAYRARQKAKSAQSTDNRSPERLMSDAALEAAIMRRGWQLTQMMRTPLCMWPSDWLSDD